MIQTLNSIYAFMQTTTFDWICIATAIVLCIVAFTNRKALEDLD